MPSTVSWLDTSAEQLKQAREIIKLFTQQDSRDELGIGTIRDALSNLLFPGTSVIQTRARYYLFVPWTYQIARAQGRTGEAFVRRASEIERDLVVTLIREEPARGAGVIGRRVGRELQTLPSTTYWSGLQTYDIISARDAAEIAVQRTPADDASELHERRSTTINLSIPNRPETFPNGTKGGFTMSSEEAEWLRERILASCPGSPLGYLLERPSTDTVAIDVLAGCRRPWHHPQLRDDKRVVHAHLFSQTMHGASLLYNLLVAELCTGKQLEGLDGHVEVFEGLLVTWCDGIAQLGNQLQRWDDSDFWSTVSSGGASIPLSTIQFVRAWLAEVRRHQGRGTIADNRAMRDLIDRRERRKGSQSRLINERMLPTWSGASGVGELTYRWPNVRRIVLDILEGATA